MNNIIDKYKRMDVICNYWTATQDVGAFDSEFDNVLKSLREYQYLASEQIDFNPKDDLLQMINEQNEQNKEIEDVD